MCFLLIKCQYENKALYDILLNINIFRSKDYKGNTENRKRVFQSAVISPSPVQFETDQSEQMMHREPSPCFYEQDFDTDHIDQAYISHTENGGSIRSREELKTLNKPIYKDEYKSDNLCQTLL